jgi:hypothetical protein
MTYIICAFEAEARVIIDTYKLRKDTQHAFKHFYNDTITLLISGMGQENARRCASFLLDSFSIAKEDDCFINLGICAAQPSFPLGSLLEVVQLHVDQQVYTLEHSSVDTPKVSCLSTDVPQHTASLQECAEMEAGALYEQLSPAFSAEKFFILKLVSDHFNPLPVKKSKIIHAFMQVRALITAYLTLGEQHAD